MAREPELETSIATSDSDSITVRDRDLTSEIIGEMDFATFVYFHYTGEEPSESESRLLNAILVSIAEHGVTPSVIAARMTQLGAPEALQGAVSAGILGAGKVYLGSMEHCADRLQSVTPYDDAEAAARRLLDESDGPFPGIGHPDHEPDDPRTLRLFELAEEEEIAGEHVELVSEVRRVAEDRYDRVLPVNATGAIAAVASDMGLDGRFLKGLALVSRTAGLQAHLAEESENPMGQDMWDAVMEHVEYTGSVPDE